MNTLQMLAQNYLEADDFKLLDARDGFVVADRPGTRDAHDTLLLWFPPPPALVNDFTQVKRRLLREFEAIIPNYPDAKYYIVAHTREGLLSPDFFPEAKRLRVQITVPIRFFDFPFRDEVGEGREAASKVRELRDAGRVRWRVPQPYSVLVDSEFHNQGDDLWYDLFNEFTHPGSACLRIVVGAAGAGKSILFQALFTQLYDHFHDRKRRLQVFPRPIPLVPDYLRGVSPLRLPELINNFIHTEVAAPVRQRTFEWMLTNGLIMWLFDGLDELYAEDRDFFPQLLEYLTEPDSQAQILICARHSLLKTSKTLTDFLNEFRPGPQDAIRVYRLDDWEHASKRTYAWISLEGRVPLTGEEDPPQVLQFLTTTRSPLLRQLSGLPYYCSLLIGEFKCGTLPQFSDEFSLIQYVISEMIRREKEKGVLRQEQFAHEGLNDWLETVAYEFYDERFTGVTRTEVEDYAQLVLREELSENERQNVITTLIQFPLFAPGAQLGVITFKHELIAEYLAAEYFLKHLSNDPVWAARSLGTRTDLADSLLLRYMASQVAGRPGGLQVVINALRTEALPGRAFANLLQLLLLATPARDVIKTNRIVLEGRDLGYVEFKGKDLREISFRNCDLSSATFNACDLHNTSFEGANLSGTRFEHLSDGALTGARFGRLERFEVIYVDTQRMDELPKAIEWAQKATGRIEKSQKQCPAALQLRQLFLKFIYPGGEPRRHELLESALISGKRFEGAPSPEDCVSTCLRFGYLEGPDWRKRIKRVPGDRYNDMVLFVRDWKLTVEMRQLLSSFCPMPGCGHVPELR